MVGKKKGGKYIERENERDMQTYRERERSRDRERERDGLSPFVVRASLNPPS